jgi:hypothetical protein
LPSMMIATCLGISRGSGMATLEVISATSAH